MIMQTSLLDVAYIQNYIIKQNNFLDHQVYSHGKKMTKKYSH